ncbi:hypothetical protein [Slackia exigua]
MLFGLGLLFSALLDAIVPEETFDASDLADAALILAGVLIVMLNDRKRPTRHAGTHLSQNDQSFGIQLPTRQIKE